MNVKEFMENEVAPQYQRRFLELMIEWDGEETVVDAFYDEDVLTMVRSRAEGQ